MSFTPIAIKSGLPSKANNRTFMCYGDTRSGKTRFAGTFPNALFISDKSERGWTTLETMPGTDFYHSDKAPLVLGVIDRQEMTEALTKAEQLVRMGLIDTLVVDSLTFYAESWYQSEQKKMISAGANAKLDTRALFGALSSHLADIRMLIHEWGCNVVWTALASPPEDGRQGGPMVSGKSRERFPAGCDHIFRHRRYDAVDDDNQPVVVYEARTCAADGYVGGGRDSGALPDTIPWPTYRTVAEYLGLPEVDPKLVPPELLIEPVGAAASTAASTAPIAPRQVTRRAPPPRRAVTPSAAVTTK